MVPADPVSQYTISDMIDVGMISQGNWNKNQTIMFDKSPLKIPSLVRFQQ